MLSFVFPKVSFEKEKEGVSTCKRGEGQRERESQAVSELSALGPLWEP